MQTVHIGQKAFCCKGWCMWTADAVACQIILYLHREVLMETDSTKFYQISLEERWVGFKLRKVPSWSDCKTLFSIQENVLRLGKCFSVSNQTDKTSLKCHESEILPPAPPPHFFFICLDWVNGNISFGFQMLYTKIYFEKK